MEVSVSQIRGSTIEVPAVFKNLSYICLFWSTSVFKVLQFLLKKSFGKEILEQLRSFFLVQKGGFCFSDNGKYYGSTCIFLNINLILGLFQSTSTIQVLPILIRNHLKKKLVWQNTVWKQRIFQLIFMENSPQKAPQIY